MGKTSVLGYWVTRKKQGLCFLSAEPAWKGSSPEAGRAAPVSAASTLPQASALSPAGATIAVEVGSQRLSRW